MTLARWRLGVLLCGIACTVPQKRAATEASLENPERRREAFEATLRVLDENPAWVDEFFRLAVDRHPKTLGRFLHDNVAEIKRSQRLADWTAVELAEDPASLRKIMAETLKASAGREASERAIAQAVGERPELAAQALAREPDVLVDVMRELAEVGGRSLEDRLRGVTR
jgi:uncharacterized membrane protein